MSMLYRDIFNAAVEMLSEDHATGDVEDYERRAGYLLGTVTAQLKPIDKRYRAAHSQGEAVKSTALCVDLDTAFPLCDAFVSAATYYLASMLVMEENERMGDRIFALYADEIASIEASLPATARSITDRYSILI